MAIRIAGNVWRFEDNIDTDELFAGRYIMMGDEKDPDAYTRIIIQGAYESLSTIGKDNVPKGFLDRVARVLSGYERDIQADKDALKGDIIVGGANFGIGSSRQQAAEALRYFGISACLAESMHRIFFRNFWNLGGVAIDQKGISSLCDEGDTVEIDLTASVIRNLAKDTEMPFSINLPEEFVSMYEAGGLIPYHKRQ